MHLTTAFLLLLLLLLLLFFFFFFFFSLMHRFKQGPPAPGDEPINRFDLDGAYTRARV